MDLCGEYWGQSQIPVSLVGHLRYRMRYGVRKGVAGAVGRIDTGRNHALGTPNEINLYAFQRLLADPDTTVQAIYDGWLARRYGLRPGSRAARTLQSILERSFEMAKRTYYTQGFWTWKSQSTMPSTAAQIDGGIVGKSTAWWDPTAKAAERRLVRPDAEIVRAIVSEKADAVALADRNLNEAAGLKGRIAPQDFADLHQRLARAASVARLYQAIASAYWRVKLRALHPDAPEASARAAERAIEELAAWAPKLESARGDFGGLAAQAPRLRSFVADLRARLATQ
jgi:alpha-glucuronidase